MPVSSISGMRQKGPQMIEPKLPKHWAASIEPGVKQYEPMPASWSSRSWITGVLSSGVWSRRDARHAASESI